MSHAESIEPGTPRPRGWWYWRAGLALLVLVALGLAARPVYQRVKVWRAMQMVAASERARQANDLATARAKARIAFELAPDDPRVDRQYARVAEGPDLILMLRQAAWVHSHDPADLRELVLAALAQNDPAAAADGLAELQKIDGNNPLTWLTAAKVELATGRNADALTSARRVLDAPNPPDDAHLVYVQAALLSPDVAVRNAGMGDLTSLAGRADELGLRALERLAQLPVANAAEGQKIADALAAHPLATRDDKLLALAARGRLPGTDFDQLTAEAQQLFPTADDNSLVEIGRWLNAQRQYEETLRLVSSDAAMRRRDLLLVRLDALAQLGRWQAIGLDLDKPNLPLENELRLLFRARTLTELKQAVPADLAWESVRLAVANDPQKLYNVAQYAEKLGLYNYAAPAYEQLTHDPDKRRLAYEHWIGVEHELRDLPALNAALTRMAQDYPQDPMVRNDLLYTDFLQGRKDVASLDQARQLVEKYPGTLSYSITYALGLLRAGRPADAQAALLPFKDMQVGAIRPGWLAVIAAMARANGNQADAIASQIPLDKLLPAERDLLGPAAKSPAGG